MAERFFRRRSAGWPNPPESRTHKFNGCSTGTGALSSEPGEPEETEETSRLISSLALFRLRFRLQLEEDMAHVVNVQAMLE